MKEKIRKILTIDRGVVYGDFPGLIAYLEALFNQEVEKRIAERMPIRDCENCVYNEHHSPASAEAVINGGDDPYDYDYCAKDYWCGQPENDYPKRTYCEHFRSRLTSSEKPNNSRGDK